MKRSWISPFLLSEILHVRPIQSAVFQAVDFFQLQFINQLYICLLIAPVSRFLQSNYSGCGVLTPLFWFWCCWFCFSEIFAPQLGEVSHKDPWLVRKLLNLYIPALEWSLSHTRQVFAVAIIMMLVAAALYRLAKHSCLQWRFCALLKMLNSYKTLA